MCIRFTGQLRALTLENVHLLREPQPGFWESLGYNNHGDPWKEERYWGD